MPKRILVVEDDESNATLLRIICEQEGHEVIWARDGQNALDVLATERFDLGIVDVVMPEMDGITLVGRIRDELGLTGLPLMMLTAAVLPESRLSALTDEVMLLKPCSPRQILTWVRQLLN